MNHKLLQLQILLISSIFYVFSCSPKVEKEYNDDETSDNTKGWDDYEEGWHNRPFGADHQYNTFVKGGKVTEQYLYNPTTNDTIYKYANRKGKRFTFDKKLLTIFLESKDGDTSKTKEIRFDHNRMKIISYRGPLDFLTKQDSIDLDKSYPDWKAQAAEWEKITWHTPNKIAPLQVEKK